MPASHEAIGREIQWTGDGRGIDFHVSVGPSGASTISTHQAGFTHGPRGGWVSIWEHFVLQVGYAMTERRLYPAARRRPGGTTRRAAASTSTSSCR